MSCLKASFFHWQSSLLRLLVESHWLFQWQLDACKNNLFQMNCQGTSAWDSKQALQECWTFLHWGCSLKTYRQVNWGTWCKYYRHYRMSRLCIQVCLFSYVLLVSCHVLKLWGWSNKRHALLDMFFHDMLSNSLDLIAFSAAITQQLAFVSADTASWELQLQVDLKLFFRRKALALIVPASKHKVMFSQYRIDACKELASDDMLDNIAFKCIFACNFLQTV